MLTVIPGSVARQRTLDRVFDLLARGGIHSVSVDELVEKADVGKATFYRHFPSSRHLAWIHATREATDIPRSARDRVAAPQSVRSVIRALAVRAGLRDPEEFAPSWRTG